MNSSNSTENTSMIVDETINSNISTLDLPFETSDDPDIIKTTNNFFASMLKIEWTKNEKYEDYLDKIKLNENNYFDVRNYKYIAFPADYNYTDKFEYRTNVCVSIYDIDE